jgi:hypothetical protein
MAAIVQATDRRTRRFIPSTAGGRPSQECSNAADGARGAYGSVHVRARWTARHTPASSLCAVERPEWTGDERSPSSTTSAGSRRLRQRDPHRLPGLSACLSHHDPDVYTDHDEWQRRSRTSPVRVQWDPERSIQFAPLTWRSLQIGLSGAAARSYASDWITELVDITPTVRDLRHLLESADQKSILAPLPTERPYPLPATIERVIGASSTSEYRAEPLA